MKENTFSSGCQRRKRGRVWKRISRKVTRNPRNPRNKENSFYWRHSHILYWSSLPIFSEERYYFKGRLLARRCNPWTRRWRTSLNPKKNNSRYRQMLAQRLRSRIDFLRSQRRATIRTRIYIPRFGSATRGLYFDIKIFPLAQPTIPCAENGGLA